MSIGIKQTIEILLSRSLTLAELFVHLELEGFCDTEAMLILLNDDPVLDKKNYAIERLFEHGTKFKYVMAKGERRKRLNTKPRGKASHKPTEGNSVESRKSSPIKRKNDKTIESIKYVNQLGEMGLLNDIPKSNSIFDPIIAIKSIENNRTLISVS